MAQRIVTKYVSDLSGHDLGKDGQAVRFGFRGSTYELDLSPTETEEFASVLSPYLSAGRRVSGSAAHKSNGTSKQQVERTKAIRAWAKENGHTIRDRGRISTDVVDAYETAHKG